MKQITYIISFLLFAQFTYGQSPTLKTIKVQGGGSAIDSLKCSGDSVYAYKNSLWVYQPNLTCGGGGGSGSGIDKLGTPDSTLLNPNDSLYNVNLTVVKSVWQARQDSIALAAATFKDTTLIKRNIGFPIVDDNFEDGTNAILTLSAGWTLGGNGITISSSGGWSNSALFSKNTTLDRVNERALIQVVDATSSFAIIRKDVTYGSGTVVKVDCNAGTISFMGIWNGSGTPTSSIKSTSLGFSIVANNKYILELGNDRGVFTAKFTDETTPSNTVTLTYNNKTETPFLVGKSWGAPGIMFLSGSIVLKRFTYSTQFPYDPNVMITGHSFVEGVSYWATNSVDSSYPNLIYKLLNGNASIAGRGGATAAILLTNDDISFFNPKYHLIDIGSNDTDSATYVNNLKSYILKVQTYGSIPVLMTIVPRSDRQTFINKANSWIRGSGYSYVDNAKAVTVGNDGVTQDATLFFPDAIHPNTLGAAKIIQQIQNDAPFLFKDKMAFNGSNQIVKTDIDGKLPAIDGSKLTGISGSSISLTTTGTSGAATLISSVLNVPNYATVTLSPIGSSPNANAATITGSALNLQPASASFGGIVTTGTQSFAGAKTFNSKVIFSTPTISSSSFLLPSGVAPTTPVNGDIWQLTTGLRTQLYDGANTKDFIFDKTNNVLSGYGIGSVVTDNSGNLSVIPTVQFLTSGKLIKSSAYTITSTDFGANGTLNVFVSGNTTITFPSASVMDGVTIRIIKTDTAGTTVTLSTGGTITVQNASKTIVSNGTNLIELQ